MFLVEHMITKEKYVLKHSFITDDKKTGFENQMGLWKELCSKSQNVVVLQEYFFDGSNACIIMEFCEGGDLETKIKRIKLEQGKLREEEILEVLIGILKGLEVMHKLKMIHRDIKTANILISKDQIYKVADFDVSRILSEVDGKASTITGTIFYNAPEVLNNESYSFPVDLYSLGAVVYELMTLKSAFISLVKAANGEYEPIPVSLGYSNRLVDLVGRLMSKAPSARPTVAEALATPLLARVLEMSALRAEVKELREKVKGLEEREKIWMLETEELRREVKKMQEEKEGDQTVKEYFLVLGPRNPISNVTYADGLITITAGYPRTVFVDHVLSSFPHRIFLLDVTVISLHPRIGLAVKSAFPSLHTNGLTGVKETAGISRTTLSTGPVIVARQNNWADFTNIQNAPPSPTVRLELDQNAHTLHFFVDGLQIAHCVTGVPLDVYFAVSSGDGAVVSVRSLRSIPASGSAVNPAIVSQEHSWVA